MDARFAVDDSSVHLWAIAIEPEDSVASMFRSYLSIEERLRAERFKFAHLNHAYTVCRGLVRVILGCYLDIEPGRVRIQCRPKGKPYVANPKAVDFNVSHTSGMVLCGVTRGCEIGVDIEKLRHFSDMQGLARRFFCAEEADELMSVPEGQQRAEAFFRCWTRKESYIKAIGEGLSASLDSFRVTLKPLEKAKFLHIHGDADLARNWRLSEMEIDNVYVGALAYPGPERAVRVIRDMNPSAILAAASRPL